MTASLIYYLMAGGFYEATGSFWKSLVWPVYLGQLAGDEAKKRGIMS